MALDNHPSIDPNPSRGDRDWTGRLKSACEEVGIKMLDHIILGESDHFSFTDSELNPMP